MRTRRPLSLQCSPLNKNSSQTLNNPEFPFVTVIGPRVSSGAMHENHNSVNMHVPSPAHHSPQNSIHQVDTGYRTSSRHTSTSSEAGLYVNKTNLGEYRIL